MTLMLRRLLRRCSSPLGIARPHVGAAAALGDVDLHQLQQLARVVDVAAARGLDDLDGRVGAAAARDDDVAGDVAEREHAVGAQLERLGRPLGLLLAVVVARRRRW